MCEVRSASWIFLRNKTRRELFHTTTDVDANAIRERLCHSEDDSRHGSEDRTAAAAKAI
jgi:hypothetical protein